MAEWYYAREGQQIGPVSEEEIIAMARSGAIKADDFVWTPGMENWARASTIPRISLNLDTMSSISSFESPYAPGAAVQAGAVEYAGFWLRLAAVIIDGFILGSIRCVIGLLFGVFTVASAGAAGAEGIEAFPLHIHLINIIFDWLYCALMESSSWQGTLGKKALGIKVTDMNGQRITFARATGRYFSKYISMLILSIGYIMAGFTERKQALHDIIASCLVIRER